MRFSRLFQPRNPLFWIFILLNVLSTVISHAVRTRDLSWPIALLLMVFAIGNMIYGIRIALRLMKDEEPPSDSAQSKS